jgi:hypothetical protein
VYENERIIRTFTGDKSDHSSDFERYERVQGYIAAQPHRLLQHFLYATSQPTTKP